MSSFTFTTTTTINAGDWTGLALVPTRQSANTPSDFMLDVFGRRRRIYLNGSHAPYVSVSLKGNRSMVFITDPYLIDLVSRKGNN